MNILFWVIFFVGVLFGGYTIWPFQRSHAMTLVVLILIALLGWKVFGPTIQ